MVAPVNLAALTHTLETGFATYWSRSGKTLWTKGETSGNRQRVLHVRLDCDGDTLLYLVDPAGPACHEGTDTCFSKRRVGNGWRWDPQQVMDVSGVPERTYLAQLEQLLEARLEEADGREHDELKALAAGGVPTQAAQIKTDARRLAVALGSEERAAVTESVADLVEHLTLALRSRKVPLADVLTVLKARARGGSQPKKAHKNG